MKAAICVMVMLSTVASASVLYNNLGAPTEFFDGVCVLPGTSASCFGPLADSFSTGSVGARLSRVGVLVRGASDGGQTTVELLSDQGGKPGSGLVELGIIKDTQLTSGYQGFFFPTSFFLSPDTRYWVKLSDSSAVGETSADWGVCLQSCQADLGVAGEFFANGNNTSPCDGFPCVFPNGLGPYQMEVDISLERSGSPEPASWLLLGSGLVMIGAARLYGPLRY